MALKPKSIIETAVELGRGAVSRGTELASRLRDDKRDAAPTTPATPRRRPSGSPSTVGAPKPGAPGGHKSATAKKSRATAAGKKT
jgi:hypothetical protein